MSTEPESDDIMQEPAHSTELQSVSEQSESHDTDATDEPFGSRQLSEFQQDDMRGGLFMLAGGFFQLTVLMPLTTRPTLSEDEVAGIGTTWTHGCYEEMMDTECEHDEHDSCGICMSSFDEGDKLTALPCSTSGCGSVWHLGCIHKWLNQGRTASCPLCRAQIDVPGADSGSEPPAFSTLTVLGNSNGRSGNRLSQDLFGALFNLVSEGSSMPGMPMLIAQAPPTEMDEELNVPREPTAALA